MQPIDLTAPTPARRMVWHALEWQSEERFEITFDEAFIRATGVLAGETEEGELFALSYDVIMSPEWRVEYVSIQDDRTGRNLKLNHEKNHWFDGAGKHLSQFDGLEYIDLTLTPFTNTLPIMAEEFLGHEPHEIEVLYIDLPAFQMSRVEQTYTKLGIGSYLFEDKTGFKANIDVDTTGLVLHYQGLFEGVAVGDE
jgi:uncharacterized protein